MSARRRVRLLIGTTEEAPPTETRPTEDVGIHATALTKYYRHTHALESFDLAIRHGEVYGYLGPNGAGKTTTIRLLLGLHRPTSGTAEVFGIDAWTDMVAVHRASRTSAARPSGSLPGGLSGFWGLATCAPMLRSRSAHR